MSGESKFQNIYPKGGFTLTKGKKKGSLTFSYENQPNSWFTNWFSS